jgi:hypothetical protein
LKLLAPVLLLPGLAACDQIAVLDGTKAREADAIAVGSACRQSGRALEDCFVMYPDSPKAQVFAGWKEMNDYMTQNKIEVVAPTLVKAEARGESGRARGDRGDKLEVGKVSALPPTSTAAANPLAGIGKPGESGGAKTGEAGAAKAGGEEARPRADKGDRH